MHLKNSHIWIYMNYENNSRSFCIFICIFAQIKHFPFLHKKHAKHCFSDSGSPKVGGATRPSLLADTGGTPSLLGGGNSKIFFCIQKNWWFHDPILTVRIFFKWVGEFNHQVPFHALSCLLSQFVLPFWESWRSAESRTTVSWIRASQWRQHCLVRPCLHRRWRSRIQGKIEQTMRTLQSQDNIVYSQD